MTDFEVRRDLYPNGHWEVPVEPAPTEPETAYPAYDASGGYDGWQQPYYPESPSGQQPYYQPQWGQPQAGPPYGQPAYGQPLYQPVPFPPGYAPDYYAPDYAAPYYSPYPVPGGQWAAGRPSQVMTASVLAFISAGLLILAGLILFAGASVVSDVSSSLDDSDQGLTTEFVFDGLANLVAATLLITGGVLFSGGRRSGRPLMSVGTVVVVAFAIYWMARAQIDAVVVWAVVFAAIPVIGTALAYGRAAGDWLRYQPPAESVRQ